MNPTIPKDLVRAIGSCRELRSLFENLVSAQNQMAMGEMEAMIAWQTTTATLLQHLAQHHQWSPNSQADIDKLMVAAEAAAEELGL